MSGAVTSFTCPVCGYDRLDRPPAHQKICPSCGTQFGFHDQVSSLDALRRRWLRGTEMEPKWHSRVVTKPLAWDWRAQLAHVARVPPSIEFDSGSYTEFCTPTLEFAADSLRRAGAVPGFTHHLVAA